MKLPRYPIYVPSKGRSDCCLTAQFLIEDKVPFHLVVEPQEARAYRREYGGGSRVLVLPFHDRGSVVPARNWIKQHATESGADRHWQLDDNIKSICSWQEGKRRPCESAPVFIQVEDFIDRWTNVGIAGIRHVSFADRKHSYSVNRQVYCCVLVDNRYPFEWRGTRAEDTDYSLQVLSAGLCTILINAFFIAKATSMKMKGGNTDAVYRGDGKLQMVREMQTRWPGLVTLTRRYGQPRMSLGHVWKRFDTRLVPRSAA